MQVGALPIKSAKILHQDDSCVIVVCPYCFATHRHPLAGGKNRESACFSGEYELGERLTPTDIAYAIRGRERMIISKRQYRARVTAEKKAAKGQVRSVGCGDD
jgi:hypothetical protein